MPGSRWVGAPPDTCVVVIKALRLNRGFITEDDIAPVCHTPPVRGRQNPVDTPRDGQDQVRIYPHRKCDETEIGTGSSDKGSLCDESSGFDKVQRRSNESRDGKKKGSEVKRELEEKGLSFRNNQGEKHKNKTNKRGPLIRSIPILGLRKRGRHNKEDQFDPEKAEKGTIVHTSKSEQDQATRVPDEEVINNGKTRKGQERVQRNPCHWRSCDEAHFWLNGYVNKQNCRIWSEANPQVYVKTPLHPEKLTVWCALWAGGIIGPYFFKNDAGHNVTINGDRYRAMITNFFIPELNNHDVQELWFQQDGATCHTVRATIDLLKDTFGDRLI
ncbi:uncharacterized protein TNCV_3782051 [Trichonephila clavipes]|nr:uncharacterized protein TNCV_3782051 [Trichonephila clavipes]